MSAAPTSLDAIRARRLGDISDEALLWLALPPAWTAPLAAACAFPTGKQSPRSFFDSAVRSGLALSDAPTPPESSASDRRSAGQRSEIGDQRLGSGKTEAIGSAVSGLRSPMSDQSASSAPTRKSPDLSGYDAELLTDLGLASQTAIVEPTFWAAPGTRSDILTRTLADRARGQSAVRETVGLIGERIRQFPDPTAVPAPTRRWAELAAALRKDPRAAANLLDRTLESLLRPDQANTDEALRWVEAATPLAELFGGDLLAAAQRAGRRLELFHRRDFDRRHLGRFLERAEQMQAFDALLSSPPSEWALHYIGLGGVGKTMLVRHLTLLLTEDERFKGRAACARVDFDHLSPEYPARAPGLLLEHLAAELVLYGQREETSAAFARFHDYVTTLHEGLPPPVAGAPPALPTTSGQFVEVLGVFIEALRTLPQPVVFILDTCEELARISAAGEAPLNVRATFAILEQLQAQAQRASVQVRVIFCGRRPLASAGAGWQWPTAQPLPPRPYLRIHAIRGFTHDEARVFLTTRAGVPAEPADRIAAIIERSPEYGRLDGLSFSDPAQAPADVPRCSPFDLDLYAAWVREMPSLDAQTIRAADADQYIDLRIMGRLQPTALRDLIPAVALLGRFDLSMLTAALGDGQPAALTPSLPPTPPDEANPVETAASDPPAIAAESRARWLNLFEALARQEWMDRQDPFLEVDRLLLPKLRAYFMRRNEEALDLAAHRAGVTLQRLTVSAPRESLTITHLDNALRLLLSDNPAAAQDWWQQIEARFAAPEHWPWLESVCDRLLGRGGAVGTFRPVDWWRGQPLTADAQAEWEEGRARLRAEGNLDGSDSPLRAAVLATYNAARLQQRRVETLHDRWLEAQAILSETPQPAPALLHLRAAAGCLATAPADLVPEQRAAWYDRLRSLITPELAAEPQALAALLAMAETNPALGADLLAAGGGFNEGAPSALRAWASILAARVAAAGGQAAAAVGIARQALERLRSLRAASPAANWLDWLPPADLSARIRLEFAGLAYPAVLSPADTLADMGAELPAPGALDADRLGATLLQLHAASASPALDGYAALALPAAASSERAAAIHNATSPLFAALAVARAEAGAVDDAIGALRQSQTATETAVNLAGQQATLAARLAIMRQFRLRDVGLGADVPSGLVSQTIFPEIQPQLFATWGLAAPADSPPIITPNLAHAWWRSQPVLSAADFEALLARLPAWTPDAAAIANPTFDDASRLFDAQERTLLDQQWPRLPGAPPRVLPAPWCDAAAWAKYNPFQPMEALILHLRSLALSSDAQVSSADLTALVGRVGVRRAAQLAWDEGELLALRLPARALIILQRAAAWAVQSDDPVLAFRVQATIALAAARAGQRAALEQALREAETLLPRLPFVSSSRITWDDLGAAARDGDIVRAGGLMDKAPAWPRGWQPWLARVVAAQAALLVMQEKLSGLKSVLAWAESYGVTLEDKSVRLPPELETLRSLVSAKPAAPPRDYTALLAALGFGIVILVVGGAYWLYNQGLNWVLNTIAPAPAPEVSTPARIGLFILLLVIAALATRLPAAARRWLRATSRPQLTLQRDTPQDANAPPTWRQPPPVQIMYSGLQLRLQGRWPLLVRRRAAIVSATTNAATFDSYLASAADLLPSELTAALRADQEVLGKSRYDMQLIVERGLAAIGWEGLLACSLKDVKQPAEAPIDFWRTTPGGKPTEPAGQTPLRVLVLFDSLEQQALAQSAWAAAHQAGIAVETVSLAAESQDEFAAQASVVHVIARPLRTSTGVRWQIQAGEAAYAQVKGPPRRRLVDPSELLSRFPDMRVAILQAPPDENRDRRSDASYDDAAMLRELAAELALAGVGLVLTAPAVPQEVILAVWKPLSKGLIAAQQAGGLFSTGALANAWQQALGEARQLVVVGYEGAAQTGFEAAWDLCLYAAAVE